MPKCDSNKVALQLYRNHTSAWMCSCKFPAYFQNTLRMRHKYLKLKPGSSFKHISWLSQLRTMKTERSASPMPIKLLVVT